MTQNFPPYPPAPYHPNARQPVDPLAAAKKASILMWVLAILGVLFGICTAALLGPFINQMMNGTVPNADPAELERARTQMRQLESQFGVSMADMMKVFGIAVLIAAGIMGVLAFFVRRGSKVGIIFALVYTALGVIYLLGNMTMSLVMAGGQGAASVCMMLVPLGLFGLLIMWLIQALRRSVAADPHGFPMNPPAPGPGAWSPPPPSIPSMPTSLPPPPTGPAPGQGLRPDGLFDPAPFGIPPPPDDAPAGTYGYPTKPKDGPQ